MNPPETCPHCNKKVLWFGNIGKCLNKKCRICQSFQYWNKKDFIVDKIPEFYNEPRNNLSF